MASTSIHLDTEDVPRARVVTVIPGWTHIQIELSQRITVTLPVGVASSNIARELAAVLLTAADEQDALLAAQGTSEQPPAPTVPPVGIPPSAPLDISPAAAAPMCSHAIDEQTALRLLDALRSLVKIIDAAGLIHLSNGVQLGQTSWYVKASDAMDYSKHWLEKADALLAQAAVTS